MKDSDPIIITNSQPDHICNSCALGRHCFDRGNELAIPTDEGMRRIFEADVDDMAHIARFRQLGQELVLAGSIALEIGSISPIDEKPLLPSKDAAPIISMNKFVYEPSITAPAHFVKAVLGHWNKGSTS